MRYFAQIRNGLVLGIAVADAPHTEGEWVDVTDLNPRPGPDWTYENGVFSQYEILPEPRIISKLALISRFTDSEYMAILSAAKTDVSVEAWLNKFNLQARFDLDSKAVKDQIDFLVTKTLVTANRANEILTNLVKPEERI